MKCRQSRLILLTLLLAIPTYARAQAWSGILDPGRAIDWMQAGVQGGIPDRNTVCRTLGPSGKTDETDMTNINNDIAACAGKNQVVLLQEGTYTIAGCINFRQVSNVTLRGAGPDKTHLVFTGHSARSCANKGDINVFGNSYNPGGGPMGGSIAWTGGYAKGTTIITVSGTSGLNVGQMIFLDQRNDSIGTLASPNGESESGSTVTVTTSIPHGLRVGQTVIIGPEASTRPTGYDGTWTITAVPSSTTFQYTDPTTGLSPSGGDYVALDTGGVFLCDVHAGCINDNNTYIGRACPDKLNPQCARGEISRRSQSEIKTITAVAGNQLTISPPLYMSNWRASQAPGVWWTGPQVSGVGIEDLSYDSTNDQDGTIGMPLDSIRFTYATNSWVKNVRGIKAEYSHVHLTQSTHISIVDSYFFGTQHGTRNSYGIDFGTSSDCLVQNNIFQHITPGSQTEHDYGSVVGHNYYVDNGYGTSFGWLGTETNSNHGVSGYLLFEGNDSNTFTIDNIHGMGTMETAFRNRFRGQDTPQASQALTAVDLCAYQRGENLIGNVLGSIGTQTVYFNDTTKNAGQGDVFYIGFDCAGGSSHTPIPHDPLVAKSLLLWGNYDVVTGAVRWCGNPLDSDRNSTCSRGSEIPSDALTFVSRNLVPTKGGVGAGQPPLPSSFYLSSLPRFWQTPWGTPPWPAIGPDVTGGNAPDTVGGLSYAIPAQLCSMNTPVDPNYQRKFNVTAAGWSSGTAILTVGSNSLAPNDTVTISGVNPPGYNGVYQVTAEHPTTISYALPNNPGNYVSGGTVEWPNILLFNARNCYPNDFSGKPVPPPHLTVKAR